MSTGLSGSAVIDYDGSVPGARQGLFANRPASGTVPGDWYLSTDTQVLYGWTGIAWVILLSNGGGGSTPNWDQVMVIGNKTSQNAFITDGANNLIQLFVGAGYWGVYSTSPGATPGFTGSGIGIEDTTGTPNNPALIFWNYSAGSVDITFLVALNNTARRVAQLPDKSGNVGVGGSGHYSNAAFTGAMITIPHGIAIFGLAPITPTYAGITATNAATATVLVGGFYCTYDSTNIYVNLLVNVAVAANVQIDWNAIT